MSCLYLFLLDLPFYPNSLQLALRKKKKNPQPTYEQIAYDLLNKMPSESSWPISEEIK